MNNLDRVLDFIASEHPRRLTNSDIVSGTGIQPHQQVFQLTQKLLKAKRIRGIQSNNEWCFWMDEGQESNEKVIPEVRSKSSQSLSPQRQTEITPAQFEVLAGEAMSRHLGVTLGKDKVPGVNKIFDLVSSDGMVVGDAKYFTMVRGNRLPPAKFSVIAEYVWLLEHTEASHKFLIFGNDRRVPEEWLQRYGNLVSDVEFFFLADDGTLQAWETS